MSHVYHVTRHEGYELSGDLGLFADLGGALVKVHEAMVVAGALGAGVEVVEDAEGLTTYTCGLLGIGWTIERRPVR
jgi:hypothetical protein